MINVSEVLGNLTMLQKGNTTSELWEQFCMVVSLIDRAYESAVDGLWLLPESLDGSQRLLIKTELKRGTMERLKLCAAISEILEKCYFYDYYENLLSDNGLVIGEQDTLMQEIASGNCYCIYR